jgi:hypothetical protein
MTRTIFITAEQESALHAPYKYFLKRAKIIKWLPDDYPLFSWAFYFLVGGQGQ